MIRLLAVLFLLSVVSNGLKTEPGFPTACGVSDVQRIHKAEALKRKVRATPDSWPWHVGLWADRMGDYPFCGGTLISDSIIVTAAHCIAGFVGCRELQLGKPFIISAVHDERLQALIGAHNYADPDTTGQLHTVYQVVVHPQYNSSLPGEGYDIAVLQLYSPMPTVPKICFPDKDVQLPIGSTCFYAGWGGLYRRQSPTVLSYPKTLREAQVHLDSDAPCMEILRIYDSQLDNCIETEGRSPCYGDSGGGLFCPSDDDGRFYWYGVLDSAVMECKAKCAVVSNVNSVRQWVADTARSLGL